MAIKTGSTLYLLKIFSFAWYGEFKLLFKKNKIQRGLTLLRWLLARWLCDHVRRGIVLKAYRCFFSQQLSAYLSNKYWAAWLSWRISWRKQRAENFLLKFAADLFPGLTSRVSLFNANVLNHKDKLSVKTYGSNQVSYVLPVNGSLYWISHSFNSKSERDAWVNVLNSSDSCMVIVY